MVASMNFCSYCGMAPVAACISTLLICYIGLQEDELDCRGDTGAGAHHAAVVRV